MAWAKCALQLPGMGKYTDCCDEVNFSLSLHNHTSNSDFIHLSRHLWVGAQEGGARGCMDNSFSNTSTPCSHGGNPVNADKQCKANGICNELEPALCSSLLLYMLQYSMQHLLHAARAST